MVIGDSDDGVPSERHEIDVSWNGKRISLTVQKNWSINKLKQYVEAEIHIPVENQKLIWKGKVLKDEEKSLLDLKLFDDSRIKLFIVGNFGSKLEPLEAFNKDIRIRNDLSEAPSVPKGFVKKPLASHRNGNEYSPYRFEKVMALPGLPDQQEAQSILEELAADIGVRAVLQKYKWTVGLLTELYPKGKVGISEVCVLGLNENKGQTIKLRIRTDDLKGFRKILSIRKVLFHELAHNVHSDHDGNFYTLMREIERCANSNDYRQLSGQRISIDSMSRAEEFERQGYILVPEAYSGGSERLGGATPELAGSFSAREMAGQAAIARRTAEETEIEESCGCHQQNAPRKMQKSKNTTNIKKYSFPPNIVMHENKEFDKKVNDVEMEAHPQMDSTAEKENKSVKEQLIDTLLSMGFDMEVIKNAIAVCGANEAKVIQYILNKNDSVLNQNDFVDVGNFSRREKELYEELISICNLEAKENATLAVDTLIAMFEMIVMNPSVQRYRRIKLNNSRLQKVRSACPRFMDLLTLCGWEEVETELVFISDDIGLTWSYKSILESFQAKLSHSLNEPARSPDHGKSST